MPAKSKKGEKSVINKKIAQKHVVEDCPHEESGVGRSRRNTSNAKAWASLIPRSRSHSQKSFNDDNEIVFKTKQDTTINKSLNKSNNSLDPAPRMTRSRGRSKTVVNQIADLNKCNSDVVTKKVGKNLIEKSESNARSTTPLSRVTKDENKKETNKEKRNGTVNAKQQNSAQKSKKVVTEVTKKKTGGNQKTNKKDRLVKNGDDIETASVNKNVHVEKSDVGKKLPTKRSTRSKSTVEETGGNSEVNKKRPGSSKTVVNKDKKVSLKAPIKRKSEDDDIDSPAPKKLTSIINKKSSMAPKKSLANQDILNLLDNDDDIDDEEEDDHHQDDKEEETEIVSTSVLTKTANSSKLLNSLPVWKLNKDKTKPLIQPPSKDVFNVDMYGEEEFGPDEPNVKIKKTRRAAKKHTKAIVVFGGKSTVANAKSMVKASHNLLTPSQMKKTKKRVVHANPPEQIVPISTFNPDPKESSAEILHQEEIYQDSNISNGNQNFFDSHSTSQIRIASTADESNSQQLQKSLPLKKYLTPAVPRNHPRLQTQSVSTPNPREAVPVPASIKEQIKTNFGFGDSEDDSESECNNESLSISPVKFPSGHPVLSMFQDCSVLNGPSSSRLSVAAPSLLSTSKYSVPIISKENNAQNSLGPSRANRLLQKAAAMKHAQKANEQKKRAKKLTKKRPQQVAMEQSSLYEDIQEVSQPRVDTLINKMSEKNNRKRIGKDAEESNKQTSDKENTEQNSPTKSVGAKSKKNGRTYSKNVTKKNNEDEDQVSVLTNKSVGSHTFSKKSTLAGKKEKEIQDWAGNVTSHFSEVEEFDLSFV